MKIDEISPLKKFNDFTKNEGIIQPKFSQDEDFKQNLQMNFFLNKKPINKSISIYEILHKNKS